MDWEWLSPREEDEVFYHWNHLAREKPNPLGIMTGASSHYLYGILGAEGVPCEKVTLEDGRTFLVARLAGREGTAPILVTATSEPVWEERSSPREALEGVALGVGAWAAMALSRRRGWSFPRDLVLVVAPPSVPGLVVPLPEIARRSRVSLQGGVLLTQGLGGPRPLGNASLLPVPVAVKGVLRVRVAAEGASGTPGEAIFRLLRALASLEGGVLDQRVTGVAGRFLEALIRALPPRKAAWMRGWSWIGTTVPGRIGDDELQAVMERMTREEVLVLSLRAGEGSGLPGGRAEADVLVRVLPGRPLEDPLTRLQGRLGDGVTCSIIEESSGVETEESSLVWETLQAVLKEHLPGAIPAPVMVDGPWPFWDRADRVQAAGFSPWSAMADDHPAIRGGKLAREDILWGIRIWLDLVFRLARAD